MTTLITSEKYVRFGEGPIFLGGALETIGPILPLSSYPYTGGHLRATITKKLKHILLIRLT